jgi:hypothetical protein
MYEQSAPFDRNDLNQSASLYLRALHEVNAWQDHRNNHHAKANWQFKTADARVKLKRLYPQFG